MMRPQKRSPKQRTARLRQQQSGEATSSSGGGNNNNNNGSSCSDCAASTNHQHNGNGHGHHHSQQLSPNSNSGAVSIPIAGSGGGETGSKAAVAFEPCPLSGSSLLQRRRLKRRSSSSSLSVSSSSSSPVGKTRKKLVRMMKAVVTNGTALSSSSSRLKAIMLLCVGLCCTGFLLVFSIAASTASENQYPYAARRRESTSSSALPQQQQQPPPLPPYVTPAFERYSTQAPPCRDLTPDEIDYTLVTQLSYGRLWMLQHHCERWGRSHPMSLAVYTNESVEHVYDLLEHRYNCDPNTVFVQTLPQLYGQDDYPVNELRNLAFEAVTTTHVVYVDVDFWESTDLFDTLQHPTIKSALAQSHQTALVIPALALKKLCGDNECPERSIPLMPKSRDQAIPLILNRTVTAFDPTNYGGHGSTRYAEWLEQEPGDLLPIDCVHSNRYEPYLVARYCHDLPPFQTAFNGYGKNKMTWILQLRREGYSLYQISSFLVHYPHMDSKARLAWNGGNDGKRIARPKGHRRGANFWLQYKRGRNDQAFVDFRSWLKREIPDVTRIGACQDALDIDDDVKLWVDHTKPDDNSGDEEEEEEEQREQQDNEKGSSKKSVETASASKKEAAYASESRL